MSWTLRCLKKGCGRTFTASSPESPCPKCRGKLTRWIPAGIAISSKARGIDSVTRQLAADYGLTDIRSPERGLGAIRTPEPVRTVDYQVPNAPGWAMKIPVGADGKAAAACAPVGVNVKFKPTEGIAGHVTLPGPKPKLEAPAYRPKDWMK